MGARSYIVALALSSLSLALLVAVFNYLVDPYGITGAERVAGFNQYKTDINDRVRLMKKYQPLRGEFNAVIAGNSRVEMGLDPDHHCFAESGLTPYNAGVPGAGVRRQLEYALNVIHAQPIERVILGVDFFDFIATNPTPIANRNSLPRQASGDFRFLPSGRDNPGFRKIALLDFYQSVFSLDALTSSVKTLVTQSTAAPDRTPAGFNPANDMAGIVRVEGPRALFDQKMDSLEAGYSRQRLLFHPGEQVNAQLQHIADFLDMARERDLAVDLFIGPSHRQYWDLLERRGLMAMYGQWQDALAAVVRERAGSQALGLWNFARVTPYVDEEVPAAGARSGPLQWFWEPAHYRRQLGDLVLDTLLAGDCSSKALIGENLLRAP